MTTPSFSIAECPWLVAVGAGRWQVPGIRAARAAGLRVVAMDAQADAPGFAEADLALVVDIRDASQVVHAVVAAGLRPSGAIAFCNEAGMLAAAALREHFALPGPRLDVVTAMTRKDVQRARWSVAGLPCPTWRVVSTLAEARQALYEIGGTCILKPVDAAGSRGVTVVEPHDGWDAPFAHALAASHSGHVIVEEFVVGVEHTVETFTHNSDTRVLAITRKRKVPGTGNTVASELETVEYPAAEVQAIADVVTRALAALGYHEGPGHTEVLRTERGRLVLVESAGRGGGFMVADGLVPRASGFPLATASAEQAVGAAWTWPATVPSRAVVLRFVPSRRGRVVALRGFAAEDTMPDVRCEALVQIGDVLGRAIGDGDRMAYILAVGDSVLEARARADAREARLHIDVQDAGGLA